MFFDWDRRSFLKALASQVALTPLAGAVASAQPSEYYLSAYADRKDRMWVGGIDGTGRDVFRHALPARAHDVTLRPDHLEAAVFARRPGDYVVVFDLYSGKTVSEIAAPEGRRFYGHGVYSYDGRYLFTTENDYDGERGVIGVWDAKKGYARVTEHYVHGIGPHQLRFMPDGETLVVAVGGILTHPDEGRDKLNIPEMKPALVYLNARSGQLVNSLSLPREYHKLSIRHLAVSSRGRVFAGLQNQGPKHEIVPLAVTHFGNEELRFIEADDSIWHRMKNYVGSVTVDSGNAVLGMSSPRGNHLEFWNVDEERHLSSIHIPDVCGLAPTGDLGVFLATSGVGGIYRVDAYAAAKTTIIEPRDDHRRWDNHLLRVV